MQNWTNSKNLVDATVPKQGDGFSPVRLEQAFLAVAVLAVSLVTCLFILMAELLLKRTAAIKNRRWAPL